MQAWPELRFFGLSYFHGVRLVFRPCLSADRHANSNLAPPLQYGIVEHAVQTDAREQEGDRREERRQHAEKPLPNRLRLDDFRLRADVADAKLGPRPRYFPPQCLRERERIGGGRAHDERSAGICMEFGLVPKTETNS